MVALAMTHQTIKAIASRIGIINAREDYTWIEEANAAARVILAAEPSDAEVEAAVVAMFLAQGLAKTETEARERMLVDKTTTPELHASDIRTMRAAIKAANAARAKEIGL